MADGRRPVTPWWGLCGVVLVVVATIGLVGRWSGATTEPTLDPVELRALAEQSTLRVVARGCGSGVWGSGFVLDDRLVTNAHVVVGATEIKVDQPIAPVVQAITRVGAVEDLALAEAPPAVVLGAAAVEPAVGDPVVVAGHTGGGVVRVRDAVVNGRFPGGAYGHPGDVLALDVVTGGGDSGGPVLDRRGDVVGVLVGFDEATGLTLAVPVDAVTALRAAGDAPPAADHGCSSTP